MLELLVACVAYVVVVYPSIKIAQAVRRGEPIGLSGIVVVDD